MSEVGIDLTVHRSLKRDDNRLEGLVEGVIRQLEAQRSRRTIGRDHEHATGGRQVVIRTRGRRAAHRVRDDDVLGACRRADHDIRGDRGHAFRYGLRRVQESDEGWIVVVRHGDRVCGLRSQSRTLRIRERGDDVLFIFVIEIVNDGDRVVGRGRARRESHGVACDCVIRYRGRRARELNLSGDWEYGGS